MPDIAVIGAGALGSLTALGLADTGVSVTLVDGRPQIWGGATRAGEGKVHLGFVYAKASDDSVALLLEAATRFDTDIEALCGRPMPWPTLRSAPFRYLVADTSLIAPEEFSAHVDRMRRLAVGLPPSARYLGCELDVRTRHTRTDDRGSFHDTPELAVDLPALRQIVEQRLVATPSVQQELGTTVTDVSLSDEGWWLARPAGDLGPFDAVVNCTWEHRAALDQLAGIHHATEPTLRLRAFIHGRSPGPARALTIMLGPYGDFVRFAGGRTYASWYPTGLLGFHRGAAPPASWQAELDEEALAASMIEGLRRYEPDAASISDLEVAARVVVAHGATDIDDPASGLHERSDAGIDVRNGWVTVRSPKLTTAPMMARRAVAATLAELR